MSEKLSARSRDGRICDPWRIAVTPQSWSRLGKRTATLAGISRGASVRAVASNGLNPDLRTRHSTRTGQAPSNSACNNQSRTKRALRDSVPPDLRHQPPDRAVRRKLSLRGHYERLFRELGSAVNSFKPGRPTPAAVRDNEPVTLPSDARTPRRQGDCGSRIHCVGRPGRS
jgi:hypothetical protein